MAGLRLRLCCAYDSSAAGLWLTWVEEWLPQMITFFTLLTCTPLRSLSCGKLRELEDGRVGVAAKRGQGRSFHGQSGWMRGGACGMGKGAACPLQC